MANYTVTVVTGYTGSFTISFLPTDGFGLSAASPLVVAPGDVITFQLSGSFQATFSDLNIFTNNTGFTITSVSPTAVKTVATGANLADAVTATQPAGPVSDTFYFSRQTAAAITAPTASSLTTDNPDSATYTSTFTLSNTGSGGTLEIAHELNDTTPDNWTTATNQSGTVFTQTFTRVASPGTIYAQARRSTTDVSTILNTPALGFIAPFSAQSTGGTLPEGSTSDVTISVTCLTESLTGNVEAYSICPTNHGTGPGIDTLVVGDRITQAVAGYSNSTGSFSFTIPNADCPTDVEVTKTYWIYSYRNGTFGGEDEYYRAGSFTISRNSAPAAVLTASPSSPAPGQTVTLTGTATDSDGTISSANIAFESGTSVTLSSQTVTDGAFGTNLVSVRRTYTAPSSGSSTFKLTATDNLGSVDTDLATATVNVDTNPEGYTNLAGNVTNAPLNQFYYGTFSTTTAGTTSPGTGFNLAGQINSTVTAAIYGTGSPQLSRNGTTWVTILSDVTSADTLYFRARASGTYSATVTPGLTIGDQSHNFTITSEADPTTGADHIIDVVINTQEVGDGQFAYTSSLSPTNTAVLPGDIVAFRKVVTGDFQIAPTVYVTGLNIFTDNSTVTLGSTGDTVQRTILSSAAAGTTDTLNTQIGTGTAPPGSFYYQLNGSVFVPDDVGTVTGSATSATEGGTALTFDFAITSNISNDFTWNIVRNSGTISGGEISSPTSGSFTGNSESINVTFVNDTVSEIGWQGESFTVNLYGEGGANLLDSTSFVLYDNDNPIVSTQNLTIGAGATTANAAWTVQSEGSSGIPHRIRKPDGTSAKAEFNVTNYNSTSATGQSISFNVSTADVPVGTTSGNYVFQVDYGDGTWVNAGVFTVTRQDYVLPDTSISFGERSVTDTETSALFNLFDGTNGETYAVVKYGQSTVNALDTITDYNSSSNYQFTLAGTDLPAAEGETVWYQVYSARPTSLNGDGLYDLATDTDDGFLFCWRRLANPTATTSNNSSSYVATVTQSVTVTNQSTATPDSVRLQKSTDNSTWTKEDGTAGEEVIAWSGSSVTATDIFTQPRNTTYYYRYRVYKNGVSSSIADPAANDQLTTASNYVSFSKTFNYLNADTSITTAVSNLSASSHTLTISNTDGYTRYRVYSGSYGGTLVSATVVAGNGSTTVNAGTGTFYITGELLEANGGNPATGEVNVTTYTVSNAGPTVDSFTANPTTGTGGETITLSASASDSNGTVSSLNITQISGTSVTLSSLTNTGIGTASATASRTFTVPYVAGTLQFRATATDNASSTDTLDLNFVIGADTVPAAFELGGPISNVALNTEILSNQITVSDINAASTISVSGTGNPQYTLNGGLNWTSTAGTVNNGDQVQLKVTSSSANNTGVTGTLTIGGVSDSFTVTTVASGGSGTGIPSGDSDYGIEIFADDGTSTILSPATRYGSVLADSGLVTLDAAGGANDSVLVPVPNLTTLYSTSNSGLILLSETVSVVFTTTREAQGFRITNNSTTASITLRAIAIGF